MRTKLRSATEKARAALRRRWVQVALALLLLVGAACGTFWTAHHLADSVTITITDESAATAQTIYTETITDMGKARALQFLLNHTGTLRPPADPGPGRPTYQFDFRFSFLGLPTQEARTTQFLTLSTLGIRSPQTHRWPSHATWRQIEQVMGMPDFGGVGQQPG